MKKSTYDIKTKFSIKPLIFTCCCSIFSLVSIILLLSFSITKILGIIAIIFMSIIFIASICVLIGILFDYAYIKDDELVMIYIFKKSKIKIENIKLIELKNGVCTVYDFNDKKVGTINSMNINGDKLLLMLEKKGHMVLK